MTTKPEEITERLLKGPKVTAFVVAKYGLLGPYWFEEAGKKGTVKCQCCTLSWRHQEFDPRRFLWWFIRNPLRGPTLNGLVHPTWGSTSFCPWWHYCFSKRAFHFSPPCPLITSGSHIVLISIHWTSGYGELQKQTLFGDKPTTLEDIKQNVAQYIHLSSMYRLRLCKVEQNEKSWTNLWSPDKSVC